MLGIFESRRAVVGRSAVPSVPPKVRPSVYGLFIRYLLGLSRLEWKLCYVFTLKLVNGL